MGGLRCGGAGSSRVSLNSAFRFDLRACFPVPTWHCPGRGAQRRGWEERSHAQHREHGEHRTFPAASTVAGWPASRVLCLALALLALLEPVTLSVQFEDVDVVGEPVQ